MVDTPAHIDVIPQPFIYQSAPQPIIEKLRNLFPDHDVTDIEQAIQEGKANNDPTGYYKATLSKNTPQVFLRIAQNKRARRLIRADIIAKQAQDHIHPNDGIECSSLIRPLCQTYDADHMLLVYPWNNGHFITSPENTHLSNMGKNINSLHLALNKKTKWSKTIKLRTDRRLEQWQIIFEQLLDDIKSNPDQVSENLCPYRKGDIKNLETIKIPFHVIRDLLTKNAVKTHGDLHRGNILFNASSKVMTFLDFEEAEASFFNPLYDLAWLVERFCLTEGRHARSLAQSCIEGYFQSQAKQPEDFDMILQDIKTMIIGRNMIWLAILHASPINNPNQQHAEANKFLQLINKAQEI